MRAVIRRLLILNLTVSIPWRWRGEKLKVPANFTHGPFSYSSARLSFRCHLHSKFEMHEHSSEIPPTHAPILFTFPIDGKQAIITSKHFLFMLVRKPYIFKRNPETTSVQHFGMANRVWWLSWGVIRFINLWGQIVQLNAIMNVRCGMVIKEWFQLHPLRELFRKYPRPICFSESFNFLRSVLV